MSVHRASAGALLAATALCVVGLVGCAAATSATPPTPSQCAVAENVNGEPPPEGCIVYDPERNMALNGRWRDHMEVTAEGRAVGGPYVDPVTKSLSTLRDSGTVTADTVRQVFMDVGFPADSIALLGNKDDVGFGVYVTSPTSGDFVACLFGEVGPNEVSVDVGGPIMDGGCIAGPGGH